MTPFTNLNIHINGEILKEAEFDYQNRKWRATIQHDPFNGWTVTSLKAEHNGQFLEVTSQSERVLFLKYLIEKKIGGDV